MTNGSPTALRIVMRHRHPAYRAHANRNPCPRAIRPIRVASTPSPAHAKAWLCLEGARPTQAPTGSLMDRAAVTPHDSERPRVHTLCGHTSAPDPRTSPWAVGKHYGVPHRSGPGTHLGTPPHVPQRASGFPPDYAPDGWSCTAPRQFDTPVHGTMAARKRGHGSVALPGAESQGARMRLIVPTGAFAHSSSCRTPKSAHLPVRRIHERRSLAFTMRSPTASSPTGTPAGFGRGVNHLLSPRLPARPSAPIASYTSPLLQAAGVTGDHDYLRRSATVLNRRGATRIQPSARAAGFTYRYGARIQRIHCCIRFSPRDGDLRPGPYGSIRSSIAMRSPTASSTHRLGALRPSSNGERTTSSAAAIP